MEAENFCTNHREERAVVFVVVVVDIGAEEKCVVRKRRKVELGGTIDGVRRVRKEKKNSWL